MHTLIGVCMCVCTYCVDPTGRRRGRLHLLATENLGGGPTEPAGEGDVRALSLAGGDAPKRLKNTRAGKRETGVNMYVHPSVGVSITRGRMPGAGGGQKEEIAKPTPRYTPHRFERERRAPAGREGRGSGGGDDDDDANKHRGRQQHRERDCQQQTQTTTTTPSATGLSTTTQATTRRRRRRREGSRWAQGRGHTGRYDDEE